MKKALLLVFLSASSLLHAFDDPAVGPRSLAMAGCGVSVKNDIWATQNNQAALAWMKGFHFGAMYESRFLVNDLGMKAVGASFSTKAGVLGLNLTSLGLGNLYSENKAGLCYAKPFGDRFSAAVQLDMIYTHIAENYGSATTACGEFGIIAAPVKDLTIGFHIFNPTRAKLAANVDEHIPTVIKLGGTYKFSDAVNVSLEAVKDVDFKAIIRGGLEYRPVNNFYLRAGAASNPGLISFGFGVVMKNFSLDVSASWHSVLGFSPALGIEY